MPADITGTDVLEEDRQLGIVPSGYSGTYLR